MPDPVTPPTTTPPADPVEVEIPGGIKVKLAPADAEAYKAATKKHRDHADELARTVGAVRAEKEAAEKKARDESEAAQALKLAKEGEMGKLKELMTKEANERLTRVGSTIITSEIRAAIASQLPGVDAKKLDRMVSLIAPRARFNAEKVAGEYLDEAGQLLQIDGKPAGADALVSDFLHALDLKPVTVPAGMPPTQQTSAHGKVMTAQAYEALQPIEQARFHAAGGKILQA